MRRTGFTLLEMIIVLAVIAVLSAIVYPMASQALGNSREASCLTRLRALGVGLQGYLQEHQNVMPNLVIGRNSKQDDQPVMDVILLPYLDGPEAFHCPADHHEFEKSGSSYHWNHLQSGRRTSELSFFGIQESRIPLISDKEAWHPSGTNFLYSDLSSSSKIRFSTGNR